MADLMETHQALVAAVQTRTAELQEAKTREKLAKEALEKLKADLAVLGVTPEDLPTRISQLETEIRTMQAEIEQALTQPVAIAAPTLTEIPAAPAPSLDAILAVPLVSRPTH